MIRDLEEMLLTIPDLESRDFMREAVRCYYAEAYRAAVVMAIAAGMDDLRRKLGRLAATGAPSQAVIDTYKIVDQAFQAQKPFESNLIEAAAAGLGMITPSEKKKLKALLDVRHLNAHPSGHRSSAEEARDAIASTITIVLKQQGLMGAVAAKDLVARISRPNFYPALTKPDDAFSTVEAETRLIAPAAMSPLAGLVMDSMLAAIAGRGHDEALGAGWLADVRQRFRESDSFAVFLGGMLRIHGACEDAVIKQLPRLLQEDDARTEACWLLSVSPGAIRSLERLDRERAISLVKRAADSSQQASDVYDAWARLNLLPG